MANELVHGSVGTELTQAEWEGVGTHVFNSQATGDIVYASSATQLSRLAKGTDTHVLILSSGIPAWSTSTGITALGTIATGVWQGTDVGVAYGGTGVSTLADNAVLTGTGASAITAEANLTFDGSDLTVATDVGIIFSDSGQKIESDGTDLTIASGADLSLITTADLLIGSTYSITVGGFFDGGSLMTPEVQIAKADDISNMVLATHRAEDTYSSTFAFLRTGADAQDAFTIIPDNAPLGNIVWVASDGVDNSAVAVRIFAEVDGTTTAENSIPGKISFMTTPAGSSGPSTRMQIKATGEIDLQSNALGLTNVGASGNDWTQNALTLAGGSGSQSLTVETTGTSTSVLLNLKSPASSATNHSQGVQFIQGSGDGSANNMSYLLSYDSSGAIMKLRSADIDGSSTDGNVYEITDGTDDVKFLGGVGVGVAAPTSGLSVTGKTLFTTGQVGFASAVPDDNYAIYMLYDFGEVSNTTQGFSMNVSAQETGAHAAWLLRGLNVDMRIGAANDKNWTAAVAIRSLEVGTSINGSATGTVTGVAGLYVGKTDNGGMTITDEYGIYIEDLTEGATNTQIKLVTLTDQTNDIGIDMGGNSIENVGNMEIDASKTITGSGDLTIDTVGNLNLDGGNDTVLMNSGTTICIVDDVGLRLAADTAHGTTAGTNIISLFNGTAPAGTIANGASFFCASGEMKVIDAAGNVTVLSPHDDDGEWVFHSQDDSGKVIHIQMERMMKRLDEMLGGGFIEEYNEV